MRDDKKIDHEAEPIGGDEKMLRLLCSPLQYDETTGLVSVDAFDLRLLGRNKDNPEHFASLGRCCCLASEEKFYNYLKLGYKVWDDKSWESNRYYGYGTFLCADALAVSPIIEIWPLHGDKPEHIGLFYAQDENHYYHGPLPKSEPAILEMLSDLSELIADTIVQAPKK